MNSHGTTATRLETKHASQVVLEPLLPSSAVATCRVSGQLQSVVPLDRNLTHASVRDTAKGHKTPEPLHVSQADLGAAR